MTEVRCAADEGSELGMHSASVDIEIAFLCEGFIAARDYTREGTPFVERHARMVDLDMSLQVGRARAN